MNINSLKVKLLLITMVPFILGIYILSTISFKKTESTLTKTLEKFEVTITKEKEGLIKHQFEVAQSLIKTVLEKEPNVDVAKAKVIELLTGIRYLDDKSGYFFAYEKRGEDYYFGFHPTRPALNNTKTNIKAPDAKGYAFREDLIKYAKEQKYVLYHYENPSTKDVVLKMASSVYIPEFNWVLVTGIYADDIEREITVLKADVDENISSLFITILVVTLCINIVIIVLIIPALTKLIIKPLNVFQNTLEGFFKYLNKEIKEIHRIGTYSKDEIGQMSKVLDSNIEIARKNIDESNKFIEETISILGKFQNGDLSQRLNIDISDDNLVKLKSVMNRMAEELENNIVSVLKVIDKYTNYNYLEKIDTSKISNHILRLANGVNALGDSITSMLKENKSNGINLDNSSKVLLDNVNKLNTSSNSAAASLEETAAALEEITSNIRNSTESISKMAMLSNSVTNSASQGEKLANQTNVSMDEINAQVTAINEAISVIDQIAFQTNILSLNAAVEAATAGEAGKGFAVVAQEVRNLASRSAEAAREIKDIVEQATIKANEGKEIASNMINGYKELNENILHTMNLINDIQNASKEQLLGIEQINDAVNSLDRQTQQNASVASQANEIALETSKIAKLIVEDVDNKEFIGK